MNNTDQMHDSASLGTLLQGIVSDVQGLMRQQLSLFRIEMKEDLVSTRRALISMGIGAAALLIGTTLVLTAGALGLVQAIEWMPLWGGFLVVGAVSAVIGLITVMLGAKRLRDRAPVPDRTVEVLKENMKWLNRSTT